MKSINETFISKYSKNGLIELYRFLFAVMIISHHAMYLNGRKDYFVPLKGGYIAVEFFFILSGYLISKSAWAKQETTDMKTIGKETLYEIWKKVRSIYPIFAVSFIVSFVLMNYAKKDFSIKGQLERFMAAFGEYTFTRVAGMNFQSSQFIGTIWYISALLLSIWILYPLMRRYKYAFGTIIAPLICILGYGYLAVKCKNLEKILPIDNSVIFPGLVRGLASFCFGNIAFNVVRIIPVFKLTALGGFLYKTIQFLLLAAVFGMTNMYYQTTFDFATVVLMFALIVMAFLNCGVEYKVLNCPFVYFLGATSKCMFLFHTAIIRFPRSFWPKEWVNYYLAWVAIGIFGSMLLCVLEKYIIAAFKWLISLLKKLCIL